MFKKSILTNSLLLAVMAPTFVMAEVESTIELRNETAIFNSTGQTIGQATSMVDDTTDHSGGDLMKFQNQAKIFLNGDIGEESTWHAELQIIYDAEAINDEDNGGEDYRGHEEYTQNDYFRELYVDTEAAGWTMRLGKQQVVWGTADGIKLLDIINPTDFREVNQNVMEDSRIPIWMVNAERDVGDNGNFQVVVSQVAENKIPGLNGGGDQGHPFLMKGVDTISGQVNGFYNIAPALAKTATGFSEFAHGGAFAGLGLAGGNGLGQAAAAGFTVDTYARSTWTVTALGVHAFVAPGGVGTGSATDAVTNITNDGATTNNGYTLLNGIANATASFNPGLASLSNNNVTALMNVAGSNGTPSTVTWNSQANPLSAFEYMPNATFLTFNTFAGGFNSTGSQNSMRTVYVKDLPDDEANAGFRYKGFTDSGVNYSLNYFYHYDANPVVDISYHDRTTGEELTTELRSNNAVVTRANVNGNVTGGANTTNVFLKNSAGKYYGAFSPAGIQGIAGGATANTGETGVDMRFTETLQRIHSIGGAFDMAVDSLDVPLVIRGEFLYDKDVMQPVVDKRLMAIGDLEGALMPVETDFFKYVIGADITVMTNLLVSAQFIQFINLDFVDESRTCNNFLGTAFNCDRYTADPTTMHLSNGLQKGYETKEFVSLFLSKPIGEDQLGRWNNIIIWEEGGGWWNRLDANYSLSDQFIVNAEWNQYFGDDNTTFGQLEESSNVQVGFRYIFENY